MFARIKAVGGRLTQLLRRLVRLVQQGPVDREHIDKLVQQIHGLHGKADGQAARTEAMLSELQALRRETRLLSASQVPDPALWRDGPPAQREPKAGTGIFPSSIGCRKEMFDTPYFAYWVDQIRFAKSYHRKLWEFVFIAQALAERGLLAPGTRGLGFGVGEEPLSALFAARGCEVVGTDMAPEAAEQAGWTETQQFAAGKAALRRPDICPDPVFDAAVSFRVEDMNHIPDDLTGFDFCWSACALEHLGSIELGLAFIERSVQCLKPGGFAIHTTEFNLSSNDDTLDNAGTVLFRRRDLEALAQRLTDAGHTVAPLDFTEGDTPLDRYVDVPPYRVDPHLRLALEGYAATSFGFIVQRGA